VIPQIAERGRCEDDSQGIDIREHADIVIVLKFRRGISRGEETKSGNCHAVLAISQIHLFGDTEVQKLNTAVFGSENIRRLQIAMDDGTTMGVTNSFADLTE
jgi:hypothetical protein